MFMPVARSLAHELIQIEQHESGPMSGRIGAGLRRLYAAYAHAVVAAVGGNSAAIRQLTRSS